MGGLVGGVLGLIGGSQQARAAERAAQASANAQLEAARIAAEEARFRPVGITTRFGTSRFEMGIPGVSAPQRSAYATQEEYDKALSDYQTRVAKEGRLVGAGYTVSPEIAAIQDRLMSQAGGQGLDLTGQGLGAAQGLFNLGQGYLAQTPEQAAQKWMASQQAALAPARERALMGVRQNLFNTGREGLSIGQGTGMQAANPEMAAYYNALAQQDLDLAARAQEQGRASTQFGAGLFGLGSQAAAAGLSPLQSQIGVTSTLEQLGQNPLDIGSTLGGRAMAGGAQAGQSLLAGGLGAARTMQGAQSYSPAGSFLSGLASNQQLTSGIGNWLSGLGSGTGTFQDVGGMGQASNDVLAQWGI